MLKKIATFSLIVLSAHADMSSFYKDALQTLQYEKSYSLYAQSNKTSQNAVSYAKYANFSADAAFTNTHAKLLPTTAGNFNTTDVSLTDTIDLFGKNNYKIEALHLDQKTKKAELEKKKEQLFMALSNLVSLYDRTSAELKLHQDLFDEQEKIYKRLELIAQHGDITEVELLRFKNSLTTLKTQIVAQQQALKTMRDQLHLYAPHEEIPTLDDVKLLYGKKEFVAHNPSLEINKLQADQKLTEAKGLNDNYLPTLDAKATYQKLNDPTSYGDNYSLGVALHIPLNAGDAKEAEAFKVASLSIKEKNIEYKLQRENEYLQYIQNYNSAAKQLAVLEASLNDYEKSEKTIKSAYMKQYIDFNTYLQVLQQSLDVKKKIINQTAQKNLSATIINAIASDMIYE